jgi:hypothetical protein
VGCGLNVNVGLSTVQQTADVRERWVSGDGSDDVHLRNGNGGALKLGEALGPRDRSVGRTEWILRSPSLSDRSRTDTRIGEVAPEHEEPQSRQARRARQSPEPQGAAVADLVAVQIQAELRQRRTRRQLREGFGAGPPDPVQGDVQVYTLQQRQVAEAGSQGRRASVADAALL